MNDREQGFAKVLENDEQVAQLQQAVVEHGREWVEAADEWVRRNPYLAIAAAVAVGCAIASILRHRD